MSKLSDGKQEKEHDCCGESVFPSPTRKCKPVNANLKCKQYASYKHYLPVEIRKLNYEIVIKEYSVRNRRRIRIRKPPERILKLRQRQKEHKKIRQILVESVQKYSDRPDPRPYATIRIKGEEINGLLDSGASVSILGKGCLEFVEKLQLDVTKYYTNVRTASGQFHRILGKIVSKVEYRQKEADICFFLCPDLEQQVYLGIDFWSAFGLAPDILNIEEIDVEKIQKHFTHVLEHGHRNMHELTTEQRSRL